LRGFRPAAGLTIALFRITGIFRGPTPATIFRTAVNFRLFTRAATLASIKIRDLSITEVHRPPQSEASS